MQLGWLGSLSQLASIHVLLGDLAAAEQHAQAARHIRESLVQCCMLDGAFKTDAFGRVVRRKPQRYRGIARICNDTAGTKARF